MLNHHARRLTVRLTILLVMAAALLWPSAGPAEREAQASTPSHQAALTLSPNVNSRRGCVVTFDPDTGQCVWVCCYGGYCTWSEC